MNELLTTTWLLKRMRQMKATLLEYEVADEDVLRAFERCFIFICNSHPLGPTNNRTKAGKLIDECRAPLATLRDRVERDEQVSA